MDKNKKVCHVNLITSVHSSVYMKAERQTQLSAHLNERMESSYTWPAGLEQMHSLNNIHAQTLTNGKAKVQNNRTLSPALSLHRLLSSLEIQSHPVLASSNQPRVFSKAEPQNNLSSRNSPSMSPIVPNCYVRTSHWVAIFCCSTVSLIKHRKLGKGNMAYFCFQSIAPDLSVNQLLNPYVNRYINRKRQKPRPRTDCRMFHVAWEVRN